MKCFAYSVNISDWISGALPEVEVHHLTSSHIHRLGNLYKVCVKDFGKVQFVYEIAHLLFKGQCHDTCIMLTFGKENLKVTTNNFLDLYFRFISLSLSGQLLISISLLSSCDIFLQSPNCILAVTNLLSFACTLLLSSVFLEL